MHGHLTVYWIQEEIWCDFWWYVLKWGLKPGFKERVPKQFIVFIFFAFDFSASECQFETFWTSSDIQVINIAG